MIADEYKLEIFIPDEFLPQLQEALARAGAGRIGNYDHCLSAMPVSGFWRPLEGANPYQGTIGRIETGHELKVEVNCARELVREVIRAVREVHPYEEPVINIIPLANPMFLHDDGETPYGP